MVKYVIIIYHAIFLLWLFVSRIVKENAMEVSDIVTITVAVISLIGVIITALLAESSRWKKVNEKFDSVNEKFDSVNEKFDSVNEKFGIKDKGTLLSVQEQTGVEANEKSLTGQHKEILKAINSYRDEETKKLEKFSKKQKNIKETLDEVKLFFEDWETTNQKYSEIKAEYAKLEEKYSSLKAENQALRNQLFASKSEEESEQTQLEL